jgi:hypothetical protein
MFVEGLADALDEDGLKESEDGVVVAVFDDAAGNAVDDAEFFG